PINKSLELSPHNLGLFRRHGYFPGFCAHLRGSFQYSDSNGYDVETYIQIYNCLGFLMQVEVENVAKVIWNAKKPVMTIKSMAAGRCTPYVGLSFSYHTIRDCDMVTVGAHTVEEVYEDIEIALAALEKRFPEMASRNSPKHTQLLGW
ncbi:MAG: hypothetical protein H7X86_09365, partial [Gorillibacterium sp.]|nr:hypothetical protein [Gorillibacterium sp.]